MRRRSAIPSVLLLAGLLVAGCSSSGPEATTTTTTTRVVTTSTSSARVTSGALVGAATTPVSTPPTGHTKLTTITANDAGEYDRVVFTFRDGTPGYAAAYVNRPVQQDASGQTIDVAGDSVLQVTFSGASGVDLTAGKVTTTYTGPTRIAGTTPAIAEMVRRGDFEDVLSWVIGTHGRPAFKVSANPSAGTVEIDLAHS